MTIDDKVKIEQGAELTYGELNLPTFVNNCPAINVRVYDKDGKEKEIVLPFSDAPKIAVLSGTSFLSIGDTRCGKSLLMDDIGRNYFGGDSDQQGRCNFITARNNFVADSYYMTIDQSKVGEGKGMLIEAKVPIERRVRALCSYVDEINLVIPEVQVEFFGSVEGRHQGIELGEDNYHMSMMSCNLNRVNEDFAGTSQINRALLNRQGVTFDFDYFKLTEEDRDLLAAREASGRPKLAPIRDISGKILEAHRRIREASSERDPWLDAYIRIFSSGLEYCNADKDNRKKKIWPSNCDGCTFAKKDLCSLVKHSNTGTAGALKKFALGIDYLIKLKHGEVSTDPFDLALESFKFTTYHGNLNGILVMSKYNGEDQEQMREVTAKIREKIEPIKKYVDICINEAINNARVETRFIEYKKGKNKSKKNRILFDEETKKSFDEGINGKKLDYEIIEPFEDFREKTGIDMKWFKGYVESVAKHYLKDAQRNGGKQ